MSAEIDDPIDEAIARVPTRHAARVRDVPVRNDFRGRLEAFLDHGFLTGQRTSTEGRGVVHGPGSLVRSEVIRPSDARDELVRIRHDLGRLARDAAGRLPRGSQPQRLAFAIELLVGRDAPAPRSHEHWRQFLDQVERPFGRLDADLRSAGDQASTESGRLCARLKGLRPAIEAAAAVERQSAYVGQKSR